MIDNELLMKNEIEVNRQNKQISIFFAIICLFGCLIVLLTDDPAYYRLDLANCCFLLIAFGIMFIINQIVSVESIKYKYFFLIWFFIPILVEVILTPDYFWIGFAVPIVLSCRYYNTKLVVIVSVITQFCLLIANWGIAYLQPSFGYAKANSVYLPTGMTLTGDNQWLSEIASDLLNANVINRFDYMVSNYKTQVIYHGILLLCISGCCILITRHEMHVLQQHSQMYEEKRHLDMKITENKYRMLLSQIKPHFIFNVLNSIIALCSIDPGKAEEMLLIFSSHLRYDIDLLSQTELITFDRELKSVEDYIKLEQMRFGDRIKIGLDIQTSSFMIPPLTLQPIVENAVKHGITKKQAGGTIWIRTRETKQEIIIQVEDDGIGFDPDTIHEVSEDTSHIGLSNIQERLSMLMHADLKIESELKKGTLITISIPKKKTPSINSSH